MASFLCKATSTNIDNNRNLHVIDDFENEKQFLTKNKNVT